MALGYGVLGVKGVQHIPGDSAVVNLPWLESKPSSRLLIY